MIVCFCEVVQAYVAYIQIIYCRYIGTYKMGAGDLHSLSCTLNLLLVRMIYALIPCQTAVETVGKLRDAAVIKSA